MQKVYIVEDDIKIAEHIHKNIIKHGYDGYIARDFANLLTEFHQINPHLVLLDINLPSYDGFYWCRQIRKISTCPVIFISARTGEMDQVMALENGGDDFITKPFSPEVVLGKFRSQLRRAYGEYSSVHQERVLEQSGLVLYPERLTLHFKEKTVGLTKNEAHIIEILLERYPRVAGRADLLEKIWDDEAFVDENTLNVNMTRVRKKFSELGIHNCIETVRGIGYKLHVTW